MVIRYPSDHPHPLFLATAPLMEMRTLLSLRWGYNSLPRPLILAKKNPFIPISAFSPGTGDRYTEETKALSTSLDCFQHQSESPNFKDFSRLQISSCQTLSKGCDAIKVLIGYLYLPFREETLYELSGPPYQRFLFFNVMSWTFFLGCHCCGFK